MATTAMETTETAKCFTPLQSRTFWAPVVEPTVALCPSMDLITLRVHAAGDTNNSVNNNNSSSPLWLHRSLDFYQLSVLGAATAAVWRPDGRWLAVVQPRVNDNENTQMDESDDHRHHHELITLYHVEAMVEQGAMLQSFTEQNLTAPTPSSTTDDDHMKDYWQVSTAGHLIQFCSPTAGTSLYERTRRAFVMGDSGSRTSTTTSRSILPPSAYHLESNKDLQPNLAQPMSVLTVLTKVGTLDCFWLGSYPIIRNLKIRDMESVTPNAVVQTSLDISHWWIYNSSPYTNSNDSNVSSSSSSTTVTLCSLRALAKHRYTVQSLAILYHAIQTHLNKLPTRLAEMSAAYASSLKPLDLKWEALNKLMTNYGLLDNCNHTEPVPKLLAQYILLGHAACTVDLSNAMDQFFTSMPMNDQLIQRMDRSLTVAMANVESLLRQILAASQALLVQADALVGAATFSSNMVPSILVTDLHQAAQGLVMTTEGCLTVLIENRFRLRDWIAWMRATGSAIKARGTAPQSAQRENALKRRMTDATLQRVLRYLTEPQCENDNKHDSLSSRIMGLAASSYWDANRDTVSGKADLWTLPKALEETRKAALRVFKAPQEYLQKYCQQTLVHLSPSPGSNNDKSHDSDSKHLITVGSRQGALWNGPVGLRSPPWTRNNPTSVDHFVVPSEPHSEEVHQWNLFADSVAGSRVNLYAVPLTCNTTTTNPLGEPDWEELDSDDDDEEENENFGSFYLTATLQFPEDSVMEDMVFFGDDGMSALYTDDTKPVHEKGQSLGLLLRREDNLELWVIPAYEKATWETHQLKVNKNIDGGATVHLEGSRDHVTVVDRCENGVATGLAFPAKVRVLSSSSGVSPRLFVSGSRGIAAIVENQTSQSRVGVWDLNEDEDEDEAEDDEEDDGDEEMADKDEE